MSHFVDYTDGQIIPGTPYRVLARLGAGGMGVVYKVEDTSVEKVYVLKTLQSVHGSSSGLADLLRKEAKTLGKFKHPNIVEVYTAGQTADGLAYFVMEELEGCTLGAILEGVGPLPFSFVWQIGREICDALFYVHHPGNGSPVVIHRDIKPENIFLAKRATKTRDVRDPIPYLVKLLDFGISAAVDGERSKGFNGTLLYAAPEQLLNEPLTPLVDLYALGCVLFQMLTGRHPFVEAQTEMELIQCHLLRIPPRVSDFVPVPQLVDESIAAALAKRPEARPRDAHRVLRALQELERAPVARMPAFGHSRIESLVSAIETNTSAGYERYATSVGVTLAAMTPRIVEAPRIGDRQQAPLATAPMARGSHEGVDELLDGLGGRLPAGAEAARAIARLAHEARREAAVRGAPPAAESALPIAGSSPRAELFVKHDIQVLPEDALPPALAALRPGRRAMDPLPARPASVSVPPAAPPVTATPLISTRSVSTADPAVTSPVASAPTVEATGWRVHGPPILAAVAVGGVVFAIVLLLFGPGRTFGRPLVTTAGSAPPLPPASLVVTSATGAVSSIGADAAGTVLTPAVSSVASSSASPAASTPTAPGAGAAVAPLQARTPRPRAPTSHPAAPAAAPSRRPPPEPPPKDDIYRFIE